MIQIKGVFPSKILILKWSKILFSKGLFQAITFVQIRLEKYVY